ncbi:ATP-binding phage resistance protein RloA-like protein [Psychroflexus torquis ATCC 700755]|uniref:ATP-binding phage resistance protein RloA-like protein n=1 Tax=Psychroflexus torquis (strain ATCC 700755 / CIP 106069 / ACAM 623) TaxID=313595 RepID=K4IJM2_PSYTT|nr:ATP-binding protein [Psychroflexus torquis]AFU70529.1 ATP-binding phage resistance protein RloA-like protein [Psychroflexus torquis ATCC 700755]
MVLEIRLRNFFSINEEVILDIRTGNINTAKSKFLSGNVFKYGDIEVLKTLALYGANASGKSNIIKTIRFCNAMVYESHKHNENTIFNFQPFKFKGYSNKPSYYFIRFVINDIEYKYSFSFNRTQILTESLYYYPNGRKTKVFERNERAGKTKKEKYSFGTSVIRRPFDVAENTSNKTLYISRASQMDREIPKNIFNFFHRDFILHHSNYGKSNLESLINSYKNQLLTALQFADSDIVDFKVNFKKEKGRSLKANLDTEEAFFVDDELEKIELKTYHKFSPNTSFDFSEESLGTQKLFLMMLTIIDIVKNNKTLIVDEIEDSLHPKIVDYIIEIFNASSKAQLIFSTHNTNLMDLNKFRKDQIWFVNKKEDGGSDLYSLYDYSDFRDTMDLEKAYLQGRFDSIPIVDDSIKNLHSLIND